MLRSVLSTVSAMRYLRRPESPTALVSCCDLLDVATFALLVLAKDPPDVVELLAQLAGELGAHAQICDVGILHGDVQLEQSQCLGAVPVLVHALAQHGLELDDTRLQRGGLAADPFELARVGNRSVVRRASFVQLALEPLGERVRLAFRTRNHDRIAGATCDDDELVRERVGSRGHSLEDVGRNRVDVDVELGLVEATGDVKTLVDHQPGLAEQLLHGVGVEEAHVRLVEQPGAPVAEASLEQLETHGGVR